MILYTKLLYLSLLSIAWITVGAIDGDSDEEKYKDTEQEDLAKDSDNCQYPVNKVCVKGDGPVRNWTRVEILRLHNPTLYLVPDYDACVQACQDLVPPCMGYTFTARGAGVDDHCLMSSKLLEIGNVLADKDSVYYSESYGHFVDFQGELPLPRCFPSAQSIRDFYKGVKRPHITRGASSSTPSPSTAADNFTTRPSLPTSSSPSSSSTPVKTETTTQPVSTKAHGTTTTTPEKSKVTTSAHLTTTESSTTTTSLGTSTASSTSPATPSKAIDVKETSRTTTKVPSSTTPVEGATTTTKEVQSDQTTTVPVTTTTIGLSPSSTMTSSSAATTTTSTVTIGQQPSSTTTLSRPSCRIRVGGEIMEISDGEAMNFDEEGGKNVEYVDKRADSVENGGQDKIQEILGDPFTSKDNVDSPTAICIANATAHNGKWTLLGSSDKARIAHHVISIRCICSPLLTTTTNDKAADPTTTTTANLLHEPTTTLAADTTTDKLEIIEGKKPKEDTTTQTDDSTSTLQSSTVPDTTSETDTSAPPSTTTPKKHAEFAPDTCGIVVVAEKQFPVPKDKVFYYVYIDHIDLFSTSAKLNVTVEVAPYCEIEMLMIYEVSTLQILVPYGSKSSTVPTVHIVLMTDFMGFSNAQCSCVSK